MGDKIWRKTSEIKIWDRNCRNEIYGREIEGVKLWEGNCRIEIQVTQNVGSQILKTIKGERKGELNEGDIKGRDDGF